MKLLKLLFIFITICISSVAGFALQLTCPLPSQFTATTCSGNTLNYHFEMDDAGKKFKFNSIQCSQTLKQFTSAALIPAEQGYYLHCAYATKDQKINYVDAFIKGEKTEECDLNGNQPYAKCSKTNPKDCVVVCTFV